LKSVGVLVVLTIGGIAFYHYIYLPRHIRSTGATEYVLPGTLPVIDTTADVRRVITTLHSGQPVLVTFNEADWAKLLLADGETGWVHGSDLLDAQTYDREQKLLKLEQSAPVQASGHINTLANVHLTASRSGVTVGELSPDQRVDVYDRQRVERTASPGKAAGKSVYDVWYLVQAGNTAGWVLGDFVALDVPQGLAEYAQGVNLVAWLRLDTVNDSGHEMPQYVAADRIGRHDVDFNHLRVFTWWVKRHKYVTAYVESHLEGYFPILVSNSGNVPYFRLRLVDEDGHHYQRVYGLFDTIVKPIGNVNGWTSTAMPNPLLSRAGARGRRSRKIYR
jgi:hypothetical protein